MTKKTPLQVIVPFIAIFLSAFLSLSFIPDTFAYKSITVVAIVTLVAIISQSLMNTVIVAKKK